MQVIKRITMAELAAAKGQKDRSWGWSGAEVYRLQKGGRFYSALIRAAGDVDYGTGQKLTALQCQRLGLEQEEVR